MKAASIFIAWFLVCGCSRSGPCDTAAPDSGSTGSGGAGGSPGVCDCELPPFVDLECRVIHPDDHDLSCITDFLPDYAPCRSGVGVCIKSVCVQKHGTACKQTANGGPWIACQRPEDCDDNNPCTVDSCPSPGCNTCRHDPTPDFVPCGLDRLCVQGSCCGEVD